MHRSTCNLSFRSEGWEQRDSPSPEFDDGEDVYFNDEMAPGLGGVKGRGNLRKLESKRRLSRKETDEAVNLRSFESTSSGSALLTKQQNSRKRYVDLTVETEKLLNKQTNGASVSDLCGSEQNGQSVTHKNRGKSAKQTPTKSPVVQGQQMQNLNWMSDPLYCCNVSSDDAGQPYILNVWSVQNQEPMSKPNNKQKNFPGKSRHSLPLVTPTVTSESGRKQSSAAISDKPLQVNTVTTRSSVKGQPTKQAFLSSTIGKKVEDRKLLWSKHMIAGATKRQAQRAQVPSKKQLIRGKLDSVPFETRSGTRWLNTKLIDDAKACMGALESSSLCNEQSVENAASPGVQTRSGKVAPSAVVSNNSKAGNQKPLGVKRHEVLSIRSDVRSRLMKTHTSKRGNRPVLHLNESSPPVTTKQSLSGLVLKLKRRRNRFAVEHTQDFASRGKGSVNLSTTPKVQEVPVVNSVMCTRSSGISESPLSSWQSKKLMRLPCAAKDLQHSLNIPSDSLKKMKCKSRFTESHTASQKSAAELVSTSVKNTDITVCRTVRRAQLPVKNWVLVSTRLRQMNRACVPITQQSTQIKKKLPIDNQGQAGAQFASVTEDNVDSERRKSDRLVQQQTGVKSDHTPKVKVGKRKLSTQMQHGNTVTVAKYELLEQGTERKIIDSKKQDLRRNAVGKVITRQSHDKVRRGGMTQNKFEDMHARFSKKMMHKNLQSQMLTTMVNTEHKVVRDPCNRMNSVKRNQSAVTSRNVRQAERLKKLAHISALHVKAKKAGLTLQKRMQQENGKCSVHSHALLNYLFHCSFIIGFLLCVLCPKAIFKTHIIVTSWRSVSARG